MARHGYSEGWDCDDNLQQGRWRGMVASATRGKRGQAFFRALVVALDAMPEKRLCKGDLETADGAVCALGALGRHQGKDLSGIDLEECADNYDWSDLGAAFNVAGVLTQEVMWENDEHGHGADQDASRWQHVRDWAARQIRVTPDELGAETAATA